MGGARTGGRRAFISDTYAGGGMTPASGAVLCPHFPLTALRKGISASSEMGGGSATTGLGPFTELDWQPDGAESHCT